MTISTYDRNLFKYNMLYVRLTELQYIHLLNVKIPK